MTQRYNIYFFSLEYFSFIFRSESERWDHPLNPEAYLEFECFSDGIDVENAFI